MLELLYITLGLIVAIKANYKWHALSIEYSPLPIFVFAFWPFFIVGLGFYTLLRDTISKSN